MRPAVWPATITRKSFSPLRGQMHRLIDEDARVEPVVHGEGSPLTLFRRWRLFPASHSLSFVQRRRPETFFTAMATALA